MKSVKKIVALGTGALMLGATIMGATAADLSDYPAPFVEGCTFYGNVVVGKDAASEDVVGAIDVIGKLATSGTTTGTASTSGGVAIEGDSWQVESSGNILELDEQINSITSYIGDGDLNALADGTLVNNKGSFPYEQELRFGPMVAQIDEDDNENVGPFLYIQDSANYINYTMTFTTDAESDIDTADELEDFKNEKITLLGQEYTIVKADSINSDTGVELRLMGGAVNDVMEQGQTKVYTIDGVDYEVELTYVGDTDCKFKVNGETTDLMQESDTDTVANIEIGIKDIMEEEAGEVQPDQVEFYLGADKVVFKDTNVTSGSGSSDQLKIGDETMDEAEVIIEGTNDASEVTLDEIKIIYTADDDLYVGEGDTVSDMLDEPQAHLNFDIQHEGMTTEGVNTIGIVPNGDEQYELKFELNEGSVTLPLLWNNDAASEVALGEKTSDKDRWLILDPNGQVIKKDYYFILTPDETLDQDTRSHVLQYRGADKETSDSPKIKFNNLATGETIERSWDDTNHNAVLKLGGKDYTVKNTSAVTANDFDINITTGLKSTSTTDLAAEAYIVTENGAQIFIHTPNMSSNASDIAVNISLVDTDMIDDGTDDVLTFTWTASSSTSSEVVDADFDETASGVDLLTTKDDDDVSFGYTEYGAKITQTTETSSPDSFEIEWPDSQRGPQVFITSGEVEATQVGSGSGDMVCKVDVPSAKLDTEVSDVTSQNLILVGGPCINGAAAKAMGVESSFPACAAGFEEGKAKIKLMDTGAGKMALLVAGYTAMDTRRATRVLKNFEDYALSGDEVEVTGTSLTDISVGVPTVMVDVADEDEESVEIAEDITE